MSIDVDRDREFYPAINKIMAKLDKLEKKIAVIDGNVKFMVRNYNKVMESNKKVN